MQSLIVSLLAQLSVGPHNHSRLGASLSAGWGGGALTMEGVCAALNNLFPLMHV